MNHKKIFLLCKEGGTMFTEKELTAISIAINFQLDALSFLDSQDMSHNYTDELLRLLQEIQKKLQKPD